MRLKWQGPRCRFSCVDTRDALRKLAAVEDARAVMTEGMEWSIWKWLLEKKRVRTIADKAVEVLDECESRVKDNWSDQLKIAYNELVAQQDEPRRGRKQVKGNHLPSRLSSPQTQKAIAEVKKADDIAWDARWDAEELFANAEKKMNPALARLGARKALESYDLHEAAIRKAEALTEGK
jgi:hypothetical protein